MIDVVEGELIFDLGMHRGDDTEFYLKKGFRVVALEANPQLCAPAKKRFEAALAERRLILVEKALWKEPGQDVSFYINEDKDDWSSVLQEFAEKEGHKSKRITVQSTTLSELFSKFGVPYYLKCDIEGADKIFAGQLAASSGRPAFVSTEAISVEILGLFLAAGYDRFQIINQALHPITKCPNPAREGQYVDQQFDGLMTGLFGHELKAEGWKTFHESVQTYCDFIRLTRESSIAIGWLDFHASTVETLKRFTA